MSAKPIAIANEKMIWPRLICVWISPSSSRSCDATFAEMASARKPIASDSPSAMTPRMTGRRQIFRRCIGEVMSLDDLGDVALGRADRDRPRGRAAHHHAFENGLTAVADGHAAQASRRRGARAGLLEPALEALHPTAGVDELLLPRVERVALGADLHVELLLRRARPELVAARARHVREDVVGMDVGLHRLARIPAATFGSAFPPETTATIGPSVERRPCRRAPLRRPPRRPARRRASRACRGSGSPPRSRPRTRARPRRRARARSRACPRP